MTKLATSYALLSLEAQGYEQASNKPLAFLKTLGAVTITCRVGNRDTLTLGEFVATLTVEKQSYQTKLTLPLLIALDIKKAEEQIFTELNNQVEAARELLKTDYLAADSVAKRCQAWLGVAALSLVEPI